MLAVEEISGEGYRELLRTSIGFNGGKASDVQKALPDWFVSGSELSISKEVALGLVAAMRDGHIHGDMYFKWASFPNGLPLNKAWETIAHIAGV